MVLAALVDVNRRVIYMNARVIEFQQFEQTIHRETGDDRPQKLHTEQRKQPFYAPGIRRDNRYRLVGRRNKDRNKRSGSDKPLRVEIRRRD